MLVVGTSVVGKC